MCERRSAQRALEAIERARERRNVRSAREAVERPSAKNAQEECEERSVQSICESWETQETQNRRGARRGPRKQRMRRVDPYDGKAYAWGDFLALYKGKYKQKEVEAYWATCRPLKGKRGKMAGMAREGTAKKEKSRTWRWQIHGGWREPREGGEAPL